MNTRETTNNYISVCALLPFWRYAVGPESKGTPAIPFYTLKGATKLFDEAVKEIPFMGVVMYKRIWFKGLHVIQRYTPNEEVILDIYKKAQNDVP